MKYGEDVIFSTEYLKYCESILLIEVPLYSYFQNNQSALSSYHENMLEENLKAFYARVPFIEGDDLTDYCDTYVTWIMTWFGNTFDKRSTLSFFEKLRYNQKIMNSKEYDFCINHATGKNENPKVFKLLKMKKYTLYHAFIKIYKIFR